MMFTGQQLLQQALAQHQALRQHDGLQQPIEAQAPVKPEQTPEQQYQDVFHRSAHMPGTHIEPNQNS